MTKDNSTTAFSSRVLGGRDKAITALGAILIATSVMRFAVYPDRPLWLDEVWTGAMVSQPTLAGFIHDCLVDVNGPLYSVLAAVWAHVSGVSDQSLRLLPASLGVIAPLIALIPGRTLDRPSRFVWCALLACWIPGLEFSQEARPYTLTLALGVANTITFARVIDSPGRRTAWGWTSVSALFLLSHYFVGVLVLAQGLIFLAVHRRRAFHTWLSALAFLPVAAVLAFQSHSLSNFASPGRSWIPSLNWAGAFSDIAFVFGSPVLVLTTALWFVAVVVLKRSAPRLRAAIRLTGPWAAVGCATVSILAVLMVGLARPVLISRYLTGYAPGFLLGLALLATRHARGWTLAVPALVAPYAAVAGVWAFTPKPFENRFSWEKASASLMDEKIDRLVFFWDTPMGQDPNAEKGLGGFFFARAGHPVPVDPITISKGQDPNSVIVAHAGANRTGVLWVFDRMVAGTAALDHPPDLQRLDPALRCRDFGDRQFGILACRKTSKVGDGA